MHSQCILEGSPGQKKGGRCYRVNRKAWAAGWKGNWDRVGVFWGSSGESSGRGGGGGCWGLCVEDTQGIRAEGSRSPWIFQGTAEFSPFNQTFETTLDPPSFFILLKSQQMDSVSRQLHSDVRDSVVQVLSSWAEHRIKNLAFVGTNTFIWLCQALLALEVEATKHTLPWLNGPSGALWQLPH